MQTINFAIVGSRDYGEEYYILFRALVDKFIEMHYKDKIIVIITGDEPRGIDHLAALYAKEKNYECVVFKARWDLYGNVAGPRRNTHIVNLAQEMLAFPSKTSKGTKNSIEQMQSVNKPVYVWNWDEVYANIGK